MHMLGQRVKMTPDEADALAYDLKAAADRLRREVAGARAYKEQMEELKRSAALMRARGHGPRLMSIRRMGNP
jgi:hypothetical protein